MLQLPWVRVGECQQLKRLLKGLDLAACITAPGNDANPSPRVDGVPHPDSGEFVFLYLKKFMFLKLGALWVSAVSQPSSVSKVMIAPSAGFDSFMRSLGEEIERRKFSILVVEQSKIKCAGHY